MIYFSYFIQSNIELLRAPGLPSDDTTNGNILNFPAITGTDILESSGLASTISATKTYSAHPIYSNWCCGNIYSNANATTFSATNIKCFYSVKKVLFGAEKQMMSHIPRLLSSF